MMILTERAVHRTAYTAQRINKTPGIPVKERFLFNRIDSTGTKFSKTRGN